jgi:hypothetical protein
MQDGGADAPPLVRLRDHQVADEGPPGLVIGLEEADVAIVRVDDPGGGPGELLFQPLALEGFVPSAPDLFDVGPVGLLLGDEEPGEVLHGGGAHGVGRHGILPDR